MSQSAVQGDYLFTGTVSCQGIYSSIASITNAMVSSTANIDGTKCQGKFRPEISQTGNIVAGTYYFTFKYSGTFYDLRAGLMETVPSGDRTVTIDVLLSTGGGAFASMLTSTLVLDSGNTIRVQEIGSITTTAFAAGDTVKITVAIAGSSGTTPAGLALGASFLENNS